MEKRRPFHKTFNDFLYQLARYIEIIFAIIILGAIAFQTIPLVHELSNLSGSSLNMDFFSGFLANSLALVVGLEFVKMLCKHSVETVVEVLMFAIARQMVVEHLGTLEILIGVIAIAVLFAVRKYLMGQPGSSLTQRSHPSGSSSPETDKSGPEASDFT